jgi:hypothetical protein
MHSSTATKMTVALPVDVLAIIVSFVIDKTLDDAINCNDLKLAELLVTIDQSNCTTQHMDEAAERGRLDMVKFLHHASPAGCTTAAMDGAIRCGHLGVVKFLHFNRTEGCTTAAPCLALSIRGPAVARFLMQHRPSQIAPCMLRHLVEWGDLDLIADYLCVNPSAKTADAKEAATEITRSSSKTIEILKLLYEKGEDRAPSTALVYAAYWGLSDIAKFLVDQGEGFVREAMESAIRNGRHEVIPHLLEAARVQLGPSEVSPLMQLAADRCNDCWPSFKDDHRAIVKMLRDAFPDALHSPIAFVKAIGRGDIKIDKALNCLGLPLLLLLLGAYLRLPTSFPYCFLRSI